VSVSVWCLASLGSDAHVHPLKPFSHTHPVCAVSEGTGAHADDFAAKAEKPLANRIHFCKEG
jgi:hypothetical protein